jgi:hypothetical protein
MSEKKSILNKGKPGYKTTEFWTSVPGAAALIQAADSFENPWVQGIAVAGAAAVLIWYTAKRTDLKSKEGK